MVGIACKFFITKYTSSAIPIGLAECHLTPSWSTYTLNNVWESYNELHHAKTVIFSGSPDKIEKQSSWCYVAKSFLEVRQIILKTANKFRFWSEKRRELSIPMTWNDKEIAFLCYWGQVYRGRFDRRVFFVSSSWIFFLCLQSAIFISSFFTVNYLVFLQRITFSGFFRHKAFPDLGETDSVCRDSNSKAFFFSILNLNYIVVFQKGNFFRILCFYYRTWKNFN